MDSGCEDAGGCLCGVLWVSSSEGNFLFHYRFHMQYHVRNLRSSQWTIWHIFRVWTSIMAAEGIAFAKFSHYILESTRLSRRKSQIWVFIGELATTLTRRGLVGKPRKDWAFFHQKKMYHFTHYQNWVLVRCVSAPVILVRGRLRQEDPRSRSNCV